ncbi:MAG: LacI family transcriptional regulator, partial [Thermoflexus sp.]
MATLREVARRAGVSIATVSYVLNGTRRVRPEVEARVWEAVAA